ncbi:hypothetical protein CCHL11_09362 [Colletotrichum chlorophyti]|uniref:Uncharacterized protein n=1 Tax=Colletotrichum chlorophyti TaxID=708187 RepID=A0A1Q8RPT6_9PEZI|nr:hypothetical protein CCHL11_09362 [Colletotrichum chlorophyti]
MPPSKSADKVKADKADKTDKSKVHKLALKGSAKLVAEFFQYSIHTILYDPLFSVPPPCDDAA